MTVKIKKIKVIQKIDYLHDSYLKKLTFSKTLGRLNILVEVNAKIYKLKFSGILEFKFEVGGIGKVHKNIDLYDFLILDSPQRNAWESRIKKLSFLADSKSDFWYSKDKLEVFHVCMSSSALCGLNNNEGMEIICRKFEIDIAGTSNKERESKPAQMLKEDDLAQT